MLSSSVEAPNRLTFSTPMIALEDTVTTIRLSQLRNQSETRCVRPVVVTTARIGTIEVTSPSYEQINARVLRGGHSGHSGHSGGHSSGGHSSGGHFSGGHHTVRVTSAILMLHSLRGLAYEDERLLSSTSKYVLFFEKECDRDAFVVRVEEGLINNSWAGFARESD